MKAMIEIPLTNAEIHGDRGTIALPLIDVLQGLENEKAPGSWDEQHRCPVCGVKCVTLEMPDGQKVFIETPRCPGCGMMLVKRDAEETDNRA